MANKIISFEEAKNNIRSRKKNLPEIDILRSVAMLAVIMIHILNIPVNQLVTGSSSQGRFFVARAMLIFAVPCFLFIAMLMLSYGEEKFDVRFYRKKLMRVGVPYLLWSIFYLLIVFIINRSIPENFFSAGNLFYYLAYGKAYEHLYFMPILLGFYLAAPLMKRLAEAFLGKPAVAVALAFGVQLGIYAVNRFVLYAKYTMLSSTLLWYFSIGFLGLWFGLDYEKNLRLIQKHSAKIFILFAVSGVIHQYYHRILWQQLWNDIKFNTFLYTLNLHAYILLATLTLLIFSVWLIRYPKNGMGEEKKYYRLLKELSPYSYGIYLMHPLFTYLLRRFVVSSSGIFWAAIIPVGAVLIALVCGRITRKVQDLPLIRYAFGR